MPGFDDFPGNSRFARFTFGTYRMTYTLMRLDMSRARGYRMPWHMANHCPGDAPGAVEPLVMEWNEWYHGMNGDITVRGKLGYPPS